jgi:hypothetical protein
MIINPIAFYLAVLLIYGIIHFIRARINRPVADKQPAHSL